MANDDRYRTPDEIIQNQRYAAEDKLREADEALKKAIADRIKAGNASALATLTRFATWVPELGFPHAVDQCTGKEITDEERKRLNNAPFVSEAYLYALLGKEEARTFLALFGSICQELGAQGYWELQRPWYEKKKQDLDDSLEHLTEQVRKHTEAGHTLNRDAPCPKCAEVQKKRKNDYDETRGCIRTTAVESLARVKAKLADEEAD